MHVEERGSGDGPPVLLIHGFTGDASAWGGRVLEPLGDAFPLLVVDLPGHGRTPPPADPEYGMAAVVDELVGLLDARGHSDAHWVGYSMGGRIALAASVLRPQSVRYLVLESTSPGLLTPAERRRRRRQDEALAQRIERRGLDWFVDHWMGLPLFASQRELAEGVLAEARRRRMGHDPAALATMLRCLGTGTQPSFWDDLDGLTHPTLVLTGGLDRKYEAIARRMRESLPRAVHRTIPDVGHTVHLEAPQGWLDELVPFLQDGGVGPS